jgi:hypothetical protein
MGPLFCDVVPTVIQQKRQLLLAALINTLGERDIDLLMLYYNVKVNPSVVCNSEIGCLVTNLPAELLRLSLSILIPAELT